MALPIKIVKKRDPRDITKPVKYYVTTTSTGEIDFDELAKKTSEQCTVTKADCYAVLIALEENIKGIGLFHELINNKSLIDFSIRLLKL